MEEKWRQVIRITVVHRILSGLAKNGTGMQAGQSVNYICMARHQMEIAREAKDLIFIHGVPLMVDTQKLIITTGAFHVSPIMV